MYNHEQEHGKETPELVFKYILTLLTIHVILITSNDDASRRYNYRRKLMN